MGKASSDPMCDFSFATEYTKIHGYVSVIVCIFGTIANLLNITILTRKEMNVSPINRILTGKYMVSFCLAVIFRQLSFRKMSWYSGFLRVAYVLGFEGNFACKL